MSSATRLLGEAVADLAALWRVQRLRTLLTWVGIAWGTLAISLLLAFGQGLATHMAEQANGMGRGIAVLWPSRTTKVWEGLPAGRQIRLTEADAELLRNNVPSLQLCSEEFRNVVTLRRGSELLQPVVSGVHPAYQQLRNLTPRSGGRFLNQRDHAEARPVAFLGDDVARRLFGATPAVGRQVELAGHPFLVVGVMQPKAQDSDYGGLDQEGVFIPATTHARLFGRRHLDDLVLRATSRSRQATMLHDVRGLLARRHAFDPGDRDALSVWDTIEGDVIRERIFLGFDLMLGLSGVLTLMVGALGVANLMFVAVRSRRGELGLLMALGATPRRVRSGMLLQSLLTVLVGGALGAATTLGVVQAVRLTPLVEEIGEPSLDPATTTGVVLLLAGLGVLAGWAPARAAARIDPAEVLAG